MNYPLPPIKLNYGDYMTPSQLFYPKIWKLATEDHELERKKTDNWFWDELNFSKEEHMALKDICSNKNTVVQKV